ncbi:hypothetical protein [Nocardioides speluncae]|uniref:hypothetical protein n=1 Tax=Nocardioides speluncae TaxID=2670337 RepID=UPI000D696789|nr:hypothetical protein [Nocardioides speluncae]
MSRVGGPRIVTAVVALAAVGALVGYLAGVWSQADPSYADEAATPLVAVSPSAPIEPPVQIEPDNDFPALGVDLEYVDTTIGTPPYRIGLKAPAGWKENFVNLIEKNWRPADDPGRTYKLRVELVASEHQKVPERLASREQALAAASDVREFKVILRTSDSLRYTYVDGDGYLRFGIETWVSPFGTSEAEVEIAATGRLVDEDGLDRLIDYVADRVVNAP